MGNVLHCILQNKRPKFEKLAKKYKQRSNYPIQKGNQLQYVPSTNQKEYLFSSLPNGIILEILEFLDVEDIFISFNLSCKTISLRINRLSNIICYQKLQQITQLNIENFWENQQNIPKNHKMDIQNVKFQEKTQKQIGKKGPRQNFKEFLKNLMELCNDGEYGIPIIIQGFQTNGGFQEGLKTSWIKTVFCNQNQYCYCSDDIFGLKDEDGTLLYKSILIQGCLQKINLKTEFLEKHLEMERIFKQLDQNYNDSQIKTLLSSKSFLMDIKKIVESEFENFSVNKEKKLPVELKKEKNLTLNDLANTILYNDHYMDIEQILDQHLKQKQTEKMEESDDIESEGEGQEEENSEVYFRQAQRYKKFFTPKSNQIRDYNFKYLQFSQNRNIISNDLQENQRVFSQSDPLNLEYVHQEELSDDQIAVIKQIQISRKGEFTRPLKTCMLYSSLEQIDIGNQQFKQFEGIKSVQNLETFLSFSPEIKISLTNIKQFQQKSKFYHNSGNNNLQYVIFSNQSVVKIGEQRVRIIGWFSFNNFYKKIGQVDIEASDMVIGRYFAAQLIDSDPLSPEDTNIDMHQISFKGFYLPFSYLDRKDLINHNNSNNNN